MKQPHWRISFGKLCLCLAATAGGFLSSGCSTTGGPNSEYFAVDPRAVEANRRYTHQIEQEGRDQDAKERMRAAQAEEVATRHAPRNVNTTVVTPVLLY